MSVRKRCPLQLVRLEDRLTPSLTPIGPEFRVNSITTDYQRFPGVTADAAGDFVVTWHGFDSASFPATHFGVSFRRYGPDGNPIGPETPVADTGDFVPAYVAGNASGQFVVYWEGWEGSPGASLTTIDARIYTSSGQPVGPAFQVNESVDTYCGDARAQMNSDGSFVVVWENRLTLTSPPAIQARLFQPDGTPVTGDLSVSTDPTWENLNCGVALRPDGEFYVVWDRRVPTANGNYTETLVMRTFSASGLPLIPTTQFDVNNATGVAAPEYCPMVDAAGNLALIWYRSGAHIYSQTFNITGTPLSSPQPLPTPNIGILSLTATMDPDGNYVIVWSQYTASHISRNIYAEVARPDGTSDVPAFEVNSFTSTNLDPSGFANMFRDNPAVGIAADGDVEVAWESFGQDGDGLGVYAQRFAGDPPSPQPMIVNGGSTNRSAITSTELDFNRTLVLPADPSTAFLLTGPNGAVPVTVDTTGSTPAGSKITLTFPPLANGRYTLRALAAHIHDTDGQALDGNGDGVPGDDYVTTFFKLTGDFNGDARVDAEDFLMFRINLLSNNLEFDLNGDGQVDAGDFLLFRLQFLQMI